MSRKGFKQHKLAKDCIKPELFMAI